MNTINRTVAINVKALVAKRDLDSDDESVAGVYGVSVPRDVSDEEAASIALDVFHESVAISTLDDFDICVFDFITGKALSEADDANSYQNGADGSYEGTISDKPWHVYQVTINNVDKYQQYFIYAPNVTEAKAFVSKDTSVVHDDVVIVKPWRNN